MQFLPPKNPLRRTFLSAWLVLGLSALARAAVVTGTVTDQATKEGLPGVSVFVKGTTSGTSTDARGQFSLDVPDANATLVFSYIGYDTQEVPLGGRTALEVVLRAASQNLNEVVVIGYGSTTKRELTGSVASVRATDIRDQPVTSFDQALASKLPGVQVMQTTGAPGGNISIRVRGTGSISAGNNPLYVIDGVPVSNDTRNVSSAGNGTNPSGFDQPVNPLSSINTDDIESIDVLKDAASAAIYGSRGSSGVVLITTKKGKSGKPRVGYDFYYGLQEPSKKIDLLSAYQYSVMAAESHNNTYLDAVPGGKITDPNSARPAGNPATLIPPEILPYLRNPEDPNLVNTDWQREIFRRAPMQSHTLSIGGGNDNLTYYVSGNYFDQDGIIINSNFKRYAARIKLDGHYQRLRFGINLNPSFTNNQVVNAEGPWFGEGVVALALGHAPIFPVRNGDGSFNFGNNQWGYAQTDLLNPVALASRIDDRLKNFRLLSNAYLDYELISGLRYRLSVGVDVNTFRRDYFRPSDLPLRGAPAPTPQVGISRADQFTNWLIEHTLTYDKRFGAHKLNVLAGFTSQKETQERNSLQATNFPSDIVTTLNAGQVTQGLSFVEDWSLLSYLGRVQYDYNGKYFFSAALRADGSSRFGLNSKYGFFPSASAGWLVSGEDFMANLAAVSNLKLRASYGLTGNFQIPNYGSYARLNNALLPNAVGASNGNYIFGSQQVSNGLSIIAPANPDLTWENTAMFNVGVDVGLWRQKVNLTVEYYRTTVSNLLLNLPVAGASGFNTKLQNIGKMTNTGVEVTLGLNQQFGEHLRWEINGNIAFNQNRVTEVGPTGAPIIAIGGTANTFYVTQIGQPVGSYFLYQRDGIFRNQAELDAGPRLPGINTKVGDFRFRDQNGDGRITADDRTIVGNSQPKYIFGLTNTLRYRGLDFSFNIQGTQGNQILNLIRRHIYNIEGNFNNLSGALGRFVSPSEPGVGDINRANRSATGGNGITSSWHVEDGSFVRVRNIALGYSLPTGLVSKVRMASARVYVSVQNPFTFTRYTLYNPEVNGRPDNALTPGEDYGSYPLPRTYTVGVNVAF